MDGVLGIANAEDFGAQSKTMHRADEVLAQFFRAFLVAPITDPDHVALRMFRRTRIEDACISRFMPDEHAATPAVALVGMFQRGSVGENAIVVQKLKAADFILRGEGAV